MKIAAALEGKRELIIDLDQHRLADVDSELLEYFFQ